MALVPEDRLPHAAKLFGVVEHICDWISFHDLDSLLDRQIERICAIPEEWLPQMLPFTWRMQPFTE